MRELFGALSSSDFVAVATSTRGLHQLNLFQEVREQTCYKLDDCDFPEWLNLTGGRIFPTQLIFLVFTGQQGHTALAL